MSTRKQRIRQMIIALECIKGEFSRDTPIKLSEIGPQGIVQGCTLDYELFLDLFLLWMCYGLLHSRSL